MVLSLNLTRRFPCLLESSGIPPALQDPSEFLSLLCFKFALRFVCIQLKNYGHCLHIADIKDIKHHRHCFQ